MGRGGARTSALNMGAGPQSAGLIDPLGIWGPSLVPFDFDLQQIVFTAAMAKRVGQAAFAAAPIYQGAFDGTGTPDIVTFPRGNQLGNATKSLYDTLDPYQGSISFWITPEWDGNDGVTHYIFGEYINSPICIFKRFDGFLFVCHDTDTLAFANVAGWTAGTTYYVVARWDSKRTIDGTNHGCISINDVHTFGETSAWTPVDPQASDAIGSDGSADPANAIIEGLTIYRRVLTDGDGYGTYVGVDDEIADIYAAGAGADPCTITKGSWDIPLCVPTDSTVGAFTTGSTDAWSHSHDAELEEHPFADDGGYLGGAYGVYFDGSGDFVDYGSDASIDDIPSGASITVEGMFRIDSNANSELINKAPAGQGWTVRHTSSDGLLVYIFCDTTNALSRVLPSAYGLSAFSDGKWHHVAFVYDDTTDKTIYIAIDGRWPSSYDNQTAGAGAYTSDAAEDLYTGALRGSTNYFKGAHGWLHLSSTRRYTPGTDFVPPRTLTTDVNTIEAWTIDQGTGTATASINSPNNDGTLTGATWEAQWDQSGTPVIPVSLEFYQENDGVDFGSGALIDDLPSGDCTIEFWVRTPPSNGGWILTKSTGATVGWFLYMSSGRVTVKINHATTDCDMSSATMVGDNCWHHIAIDWDVGTLTGRMFIDGVLERTNTAVGAYQADAAADCLANARNAIGAGDGICAIGPIRLSNTRRYTTTYFLPPPRTNWPANDANAQLITRMNDGAGATVTDYSGNGYNGTVTFGTTTKWHSTPDMEIDCPGGRAYQGGYGLGVDAADEGVTQVITGLTAGDGYVMRVPITWDPDCAAQPYIRVYDETGAAQVVQFAAPLMTGAHTGANNSATLIVAGARFTQDLIGATLDNVTDGSTTTITAVSGDGTTITGVLAGGTDNDWDTGDVFRIRVTHQRVWAETFCWTVPAGSTSVSIQVRNANSEGVCYVHQVECLENLLANGDHESLTGGNPDLITGWTNQGLDPGDTQASTAGGGVVHSGAEALEWAVGASGEEMREPTASGVVGGFFSGGFWTYGDGTVGLYLQTGSNARGVLQYNASVGNQLTSQIAQYWLHTGAVWRILDTSPRWELGANAGASGNRYSDDAYAFECNSVTLTVTPASQANSLESGGIRVDGLDTCFQLSPVAILTPTHGMIRLTWIPRHEDADAVAFGNPSAWLFRVDGGANNYIDLVWNVANNLRLQFNANGAGVQIGNWATGGGAILPGTPYALRVDYNATRMRLYVDNVLRVTINAPTGFTWVDPMATYWGSTDASINQCDAVFAAP